MKHDYDSGFLKPVAFYLYLKFCDEFRNTFMRMEVEAHIHQFSSGYFEIKIPLYNDFYASFSIRDEIRLEFYRLKFKSENYQMREQVHLDFDDLPWELASVLEPGEKPFTIYPESPILDILAGIKAIQKERDNLMPIIMKAYALQFPCRYVDPF